MSELPKETTELIELLGRQTASGQRQWDKGSSETEFLFVHDAGSVLISSIDGDGAAPYEIRIFDTAGTLVERYTTADPGSDTFADLYEVARRSSVKPSAVVRNLLTELQPPEDDIPF